MELAAADWITVTNAIGQDFPVWFRKNFPAAKLTPHVPLYYMCSDAVVDC